MTQEDLVAQRDIALEIAVILRKAYAGLSDTTKEMLVALSEKTMLQELVAQREAETKGGLDFHKAYGTSPVTAEDLVAKNDEAMKIALALLKPFEAYLTKTKEALDAQNAHKQECVEAVTEEEVEPTCVVVLK